MFSCFPCLFFPFLGVAVGKPDLGRGVTSVVPRSLGAALPCGMLCTTCSPPNFHHNPPLCVRAHVSPAFCQRKAGTGGPGQWLGDSQRPGAAAPFAPSRKLEAGSKLQAVRPTPLTRSVARSQPLPEGCWVTGCPGAPGPMCRPLSAAWRGCRAGGLGLTFRDEKPGS